MVVLEVHHITIVIVTYYDKIKNIKEIKNNGND